MTPDIIRTSRCIAGLTQAVSADLVHVTARTWRSWELGSHPMPRGLFELYLIRTDQLKASEPLPEPLSADFTPEQYPSKGSNQRPLERTSERPRNENHSHPDREVPHL